jgi:hypothetical protein
MPSFTMTVPYARTSPIHIPRRDLVLAAADSLALRVTVVDVDNPSALPIELTGGIGGPAAQFIVWADAPGQFHDDYGTMLPVSGQVLWSGLGTLSDAPGSFDFSLPSGTMSQWPRRCRWAVQLNYDTDDAEVLMAGNLHVRMLGQSFMLPPIVLQTDDFIPVLEDDTTNVLA